MEVMHFEGFQSGPSCHAARELDDAEQTGPTIYLMMLDRPSGQLLLHLPDRKRVHVAKVTEDGEERVCLTRIQLPQVQTLHVLRGAKDRYQSFREASCVLASR